MVTGSENSHTWPGRTRWNQCKIPPFKPGHIGIHSQFHFLRWITLKHRPAGHKPSLKQLNLSVFMSQMIPPHPLMVLYNALAALASSRPTILYPGLQFMVVCYLLTSYQALSSWTFPLPTRHCFSKFLIPWFSIPMSLLSFCVSTAVLDGFKSEIWII